MSEDFFIFEWPEDETAFVIDYFNSLDLENGEFQESLPMGCDTALEALDVSHWTFKENMVKPFDSRLVIFDSTDEYDDKLSELVKKMAQESIPMFKGDESLEVVRSAVQCYPADDGFMGWHNNANYPAWRIYLTYTEEADKSYISYYDEETKEEVRSYDKKGITCRAFNLRDTLPLRHCVFAQTQRWSLGFKVYGGEQAQDPSFYAASPGVTWSLGFKEVDGEQTNEQE